MPTMDPETETNHMARECTRWFFTLHMYECSCFVFLSSTPILSDRGRNSVRLYGYIRQALSVHVPISLLLGDICPAHDRRCATE